MYTIFNIHKRQNILTIRHCKHVHMYIHVLENQFRPPIALRTDLSHITTELWEISVLRMAH